MNTHRCHSKHGIVTSNAIKEVVGQCTVPRIQKAKQGLRRCSVWRQNNAATSATLIINRHILTTTATETFLIPKQSTTMWAHVIWPSQMKRRGNDPYNLKRKQRHKPIINLRQRNVGRWLCMCSGMSNGCEESFLSMLSFTVDNGVEAYVRLYP